MQEYVEFVQKGFRFLLGAMSNYIYEIIHKQYGNNWWEKVFYLLNDQKDLPRYCAC